MKQKYPKKKKIGIVVEGDSEIRALPEIFSLLEARISKTFLRPLRVAVDPLAPPPVIGRGSEGRIRLAQARGADAVVLLLDREGAAQSAAERARDIEQILSRDFDSSVTVVIKDRTFENWLIAASSAFEKHPARYPDASRIARGFTHGRADHCENAERVINFGMRKGSYDKTRDAPQILSSATIEEMARNSRSFRRFLAVCGDPTYSGGSCRSLESS